MLLWINGPFGIGKTATAQALQAAARDQGRRARIFDPEIVGTALQRIVPRALRPGDFRAQRSWRLATRLAVRMGVGRPEFLIVPMTIDDPALLRFLTGDRLDRVVQLTASREVVEQRIRDRGIALDWCLRHLDSWPDLDALGTPIDVDRDLDVLVGELLARFG